MAFVLPFHGGILRSRSSMSCISPKRRPRMRFAPSVSRRATANAREEPPSEEAYILSDPKQDDDHFWRKSAVLPDVEDNALSESETPYVDNGMIHEEEVSAPGIVQTTADLDGRVIFGEFLSTFLFVYLSVNAASLGSPLANSLNNAAVIAAIAASFMPVSGAHLNPAVTLALLVTKRVSAKRAVAFVPMQLLASVAACAMAHSLGTTVAFAGISAAATKTELIRAFFAEFVPMFLIVAVVFQTAVATEREGGVGGKIAALYIGLAVLACAGTFLTGVFNPARAFGPAFVSGNFAHHWVYWVGPCLGATVAAFTCEHLFLAPASGRMPKSWLADLSRKSSNLGNRVKTLGVAGLIAYGIMNTLYYGTVFSYMMVKVGFSSGAKGVARAWIVTWSLSQVTKPLRLAASVALAPFINRLLKLREQRRAGSR